MANTKPIRILFALLALLFFTTPIAARTLGITAQPFENRRFAERPKLSQGWEALQQTTQYLTDRMPLRAQAIRTNTHIWTNVFGTDPPYARDTALANDQALPFAGAIDRDGRGPRLKQDGAIRGPTIAGQTGASDKGQRAPDSTVVTGRDGWLYYLGDFSTACNSTVSNHLALQRWGGLVQAVRDSGRDAALFVAPYKASVYPEHLPAKYPFDDCALESKQRLWDVLSRDGPALGVIELRSELLRLKADAGDNLFMRKDTHWSTLGALVLVRAALDAIGGGVRLEPNEIVDRGSIPYTGDLTIIDGTSETDRTVDYGIARAPGAPRVPGRTVLVCDSFAYRWMRLFKPYFDDVRYVTWYDDDDKIVAAIRRADRVVIETTEWSLKAQASEGDHVVTVARRLKASR